MNQETIPTEPPTEEPRYTGLKEVMTMAWPIMLGAMSFVVMDFVDKIFVSKLGNAHLAAVGSAGIWAYTLSIFVLGISACVSTFASQSLGRGNKENVARYTWQGIYISALAGLITLIVWPLSEPLFRAMNHAPDVTQYELEYFKVRIFGFAFVTWQAAQAAFFMSIGRPKIPMVVSIIVNIINIILDYLLIFGKFGFPEMGISGAAVATVASIGIQVVLLQAIFMSDHFNDEYQTRSTYALDRTKIGELFKIGWPSGLSGFLDIASWSVFTSFIVGGFGTAQLAAHTAAINFMHLSFVPAIALNHAIAPIVGQWIGKKNIALAKARAYSATKVAMVIMVTVGINLAVFGKTLIRVFTDDPEIIDVGHVLLICAAVFALFDAVNIVISGALRGAGDTRWMMIVMFIGAWFVSLPLAWFFSVTMGLEAKGAWIGVTFYIIGLSGVFLHRFHGEKWRHINIFAEEGESEDDDFDAIPPADTVKAQETGTVS
ncbi:MAG TPA: MATE family efflux transporter [Candidatus Hydrogenedentes bacterium]|nr:MATE family efflux transporter [Candidatus Hydrogenedentota bacterium]